MESLSLCIVAGVVLFYQTLFWTRFPDRSKYTEGVGGNKKNISYDVTVSNGVNLCDPAVYSQARATLESVFSPGTAASVMARPRTLCISTVTMLVILAVAGEHYLPASICRCTSFWVFAYKVKQLVTLQKFFFAFPTLYVVVFIAFFFFFWNSLWERNVSRQCCARHGGYEARFAIAVIIVG